MVDVAAVEPVHTRDHEHHRIPRRVEGLRIDAGSRPSRPRRARRGGLRAARSERGGQDDCRRDRRGLPTTGLRSCQRARIRSGRRRRVVSIEDRHRAPADDVVRTFDRTRDRGDVRSAVPRLDARDRGDRPGRPRRPRATRSPTPCRADNVDDSISRAGSSGAPNCCSSTNRPPVSTRRPAEQCGRSSEISAIGE